MPKNFIIHKYHTLKQWFIKLGFWKKLILIFTINTFIILIVMDVLMQILFGRVNQNILKIANDQTDQYITISNSLVAISDANLLLTGIELFADFIVQIDASIHFFRNRTNIYQSLLSGVSPYNPPLSSQFTGIPDFRKPVQYYFSPNSTFHNEPYLDLLLSSLFGQQQQQRIKRMNIVYQSLSNPSDIFARTLPGTNDFTIPSIQQINNRMNPLVKDYITITGLYNDTFTLLANKSELFALRTLQQIGNFRILMQLEIYQSTLANIFDSFYYYPSSSLVLFKIISMNPPSYQLLNVNSYSLDLSTCFQHGIHQFILSNGSILDSYSIAINQSFYIGQSPFIINSDQMSSTSTANSFRLVLLSQKQQLSTPNIFMIGFLKNLSTTLSYIIYGWSFVIILSTIGLSIVTGNYIFHNLKALSVKLQEYTKQPNKINKIIFELKELECRGIIKKLVDNIITIVEKIQERKKYKNPVISPMIYPVNLGEKQFAIKHNLGDQQRWEKWKQALLEAQKNIKDQNKNNLKIEQRKNTLKRPPNIKH